MEESDKLENLKVELDGVSFESSPVISSTVLAIVESKRIERENLVAFVINFEKQKLFVQVDKKNIHPHDEGKYNELKAGMFVIIIGQIADKKMVGVEKFGVLRVLDAEEVLYSLVEELDPQLVGLIK